MDKNTQKSFSLSYNYLPGSAARVHLQPAEHILFYKEFSKMSPSAFSILGPPQAQGGIKPGPKPSLDRRGCVCKISSRLVQGFGFPLTLHKPTDKQTSVHPYLYI